MRILANIIFAGKNAAKYSAILTGHAIFGGHLIQQKDKEENVRSRREFLKTGVCSALAGAAVTSGLSTFIPKEAGAVVGPTQAVGRPGFDAGDITGQVTQGP